MTKIDCNITYLTAREEAIHYEDITDDLKKLYPSIFPPEFTSRNIASILSAEITRKSNPRVLRGEKRGYYTVPK